MWWAVAALFVAVGAGLGGLTAVGFTTVARKAIVDSLVTWRLGASSGLTPRDRAFAKRQLDQNTLLIRFLLPIVVWGFRIGITILGAAYGYMLAQKVGGQA